MNDCIFCQIVAGDIPSYCVYEDDLFYAFLDIYPRVKGHTLVIPKKHHRWVYDVPEFGAYWEAAKNVTDAMQKVLNPLFITYVTHGLEVPHAHIHILPREKAEMSFVPNQKKIRREEREEIAEKSRNSGPL